MKKLNQKQLLSCCFLVLLSILSYLPEASGQTVQTPRNSNDVSINGVVYDDLGETLPGATVVIKKDKKVWGITTNKDGKFVLNIPKTVASSKGLFIQVTYVGFQPTKVALIPGTTSYRIKMKGTSKEFEDVIVTGYGDINPNKTTGSITSLKMDDILTPNITTLDQALEGQVPGLLYIKNSGEEGVTGRMRLRGTHTIMGNREPLWVLNGVPLSDPPEVTPEQLNDPDYINYIGNAISGINPQDIERIDVLKDAAATTLYGVRASNGVIVVTTKKGQAGPPTINYSTSMRVSIRPRYSDHNIHLMTSQERVQFGQDLVESHFSFPKEMTMVGYEGAYYRYITGQSSYQQFVDEVNLAANVNTDWFKLLTQDAFNQSHSVSISGGHEKLRYYGSLGYNKTMGTIKTQKGDRYTSLMSLQSNITKNLIATVRLNASVQSNQQVPGTVNVLNYAYNTTRALPAYNPDGTLYYYQRHAYNIGAAPRIRNYGKFRYNIINEMENAKDTHENNSILASLDLRYNSRILSLSFNTSYQRYVGNSQTWYGEETNYVSMLKNGEAEIPPQTGQAGYSELPYGGLLNIRNDRSETFNSRLNVNFHKSFGEHMISAMIGSELRATNTEGLADQTRGYFKNRGKKYFNFQEGDKLKDFPHYADWVAKNHRTITSNKTNTIHSYASLSYSYGDYGTLTFNASSDASNKFGSRSNERLLPAWSISTMLNLKRMLSPENRVIDDWRLRASYGKTGLMIDGQTPNLQMRMGTIDLYYNEYVSYLHRSPNPNLRWEQSRKVNLGTDISLFDNRFAITGEVFHSHTSDAFNTFKVSTVNGQNEYVMNGSDLENTSLELSLSVMPIRTRDLRWNIRTNYSKTWNKVLNGTAPQYQLNDYLEGKAVIEGQPISTFYSYRFLGLNPKNGMPLFDDFIDRAHLLEGKGMAEIADRVMVNSGLRDPIFHGNIYNSITWKQFSLSTTFNYSIGNKIRLFAMYGGFSNSLSAENNVRKEFINRWKAPGDERFTRYPAIMSPSDPEYGFYNTHWSAASEGSQGFKAFASNYWDMYDKSDERVVSGSYLRLSNLSLRYTFRPEQLKKTPFQTLAINFTSSNVFTIASKKLKGQDPGQSGFTPSTVVSRRPNFTVGLYLSF